jgi:PAS domain S-box-containing protein
VSHPARSLAVGLALGAVLLLAWFAAWDVFGSWLAGTLHSSIGTVYLARGIGAAMLASVYATFAVRRAMRQYTQALEAAVERRTAQLRAAMNLAVTQERRFHEVIESANDGFILLDPHGTIRYFNAAAERLFGYKRGEVIGQPCTVLLSHGACPEAVAAGIRGDPLPDSMGRVHEIAGTRKDGSHFAADCILEAPRVDDEVAFSAVVRDISERRRAEAERRQHEEMFRTLIEQSPDSILVVARDSLRIRYANPAAVGFLKYGTAQELLGRLAEEIIQPSERAEMTTNTARIRKTGEKQPPVERSYLCKDGGVAVAEAVALPIEFEGQPSIMAILRDLTERKRLEARLVGADRMASVGMLAAGVTHEINNPLAYVSANVNFAIETLSVPGGLGDPGVKDVIEALRESQEGVERMRVIVRDMKTFAHTEDVAKAPVEVRRVLETSGRMAANEVRHRARLVKDYAAEPLLVAGSESRLNQVFLNLIVNAAQAIPPGKTDRNEIRLSTRSAAGGRVAIEVSDTGPGIPPDVLKRLFTPFFTTKPAGVGTGLGLAICRDIVRSMGGEIEVESQLGRGATFRVLFPRAEAIAAAPADQTAPSKAHEKRRGRILVVDDNPMIRTAVARILGSDHEVLLADDAGGALDLVGAGARYDLVLCDVMMPEIGGVTFFEELRRLAPELAPRVVFMTGGVFTERESKFLDAIANPKIEKPFGSDWLRTFVQGRLAASASSGK